MQLSALVDEATQLEPTLGWARHGGDFETTEIDGIGLDSRVSSSGELFFCVPGDVTDGHLHARDAVDRGATALVVQRWLEVNVAQVRVTNVRRAMAWISAVFHHHPSTELDVVGITGTNGKTTTAHLVKSILDHAGRPSGVIGTLTGARTTPEAPHLQASLRAMVDAHMEAVAMEVSSHALSQDRTLGTHFQVGVFTNLSPDHLDYHQTLDNYFEAKAALFHSGLIDAAVINGDDEYGRRLLAELDIPTFAYSLDQLEDQSLRIDGSTFKWRGHVIRFALPGRFNMENALAAGEAVRLLGLPEAVIAAGLSAAGQVGGRFEVVLSESDGGPTVIVDYSHTPAAIEQMLLSVREIDPAATVCVVFGAGGDRDRTKRPLMGAAAEAHADHVVLTSDNPRSEDPDAIIAEVLSGMTDPESVDVEPDRRRAIALALAQHGPEHIVVVAGKGHENTQTVGSTVLDFDDRKVVRELAAGGVM